MTGTAPEPANQVPCC